MDSIWKLLEAELGPRFYKKNTLNQAILSLSALFTENRSQMNAQYFQHPKTLQAYLAYYLPLNCQKILTTLTKHRFALPKDLPKNFSILDYGSGPGSASLALLLFFSRLYKKKLKNKLITIHLIDLQKETLTLAQKLIQAYADQLGLNVQIQTDQKLENTTNAYDFIIAANIFNEMNYSASRNLCTSLLTKSKGFYLILEPSHRVSSQRLIDLRDSLLKADRSTHIIGPCTHQQECPLFKTKHWCHFAEKTTDQNLIHFNLKIFKDPRHYLKYSYLFFQRNLDEAPSLKENQLFRIIGDLHQSGPRNLALDICQPKHKFVLKLPRILPRALKEQLKRGNLIRLEAQTHRIVKVYTHG